MKNQDIISVDPGKITLGENNKINVDFLRTEIYKEPAHQDLFKTTVNYILPKPSVNLKQFNNMILPLRVIFASLFIIIGINSLALSNPSNSILLSISEIIFGASLALGFLPRIFMGVSSIAFCILGLISLRAGSPDMQSFLLMFGSIVFYLFGAGTYSCDFMLRKIIWKHKKNNLKNSAELSYKAFHYATKNF